MWSIRHTNHCVNCYHRNDHVDRSLFMLQPKVQQLENVLKSVINYYTVAFSVTLAHLLLCSLSMTRDHNLPDIIWVVVTLTQQYFQFQYKCISYSSVAVHLLDTLTTLMHLVGVYLETKTPTVAPHYHCQMEIFVITEVFNNSRILAHWCS